MIIKIIKNGLNRWNTLAGKIIQGEQEPGKLLFLILFAITIVLLPSLITGKW